MIPPHKTPSVNIMEKIRRYIVEQLCDTADVIEEARRKLPHPTPRPFEDDVSVTALRAAPAYMKRPAH